MCEEGGEIHNWPGVGMVMYLLKGLGWNWDDSTECEEGGEIHNWPGVRMVLYLLKGLG